ncbi:ribosome maturation protein SBDS [Chryseobacterium gleum]|uniref:hypothetical protein n=1 Tax=Chryseobacterium gleum TaxID=250 RepID=UPI001E5BC9CA|nr:hypothetical protein [Chryseobacterium gleum]MCD9617239.1 hypothetical protein [Chryseobacterium gleum]
MKNINPIVIFLALMLHLNISGQTFNITERQIQINTNNIFRPASKVEMITSLKFKNDYYSIFEETQMYDFGHKRKYLIKYNLQGEILFSEKLPEELSNSYYLDLFALDDHVYAQLNNNTRYVLDTKSNQFIETTKGDDLVYKDDNYKVMYKSFGEWGQATWFINTKDKSEFFASLNGKNINFLAGKFYITNLSSIWEITNPKKLTRCKPNQYYDYINKKEFGMFDSYDYNKGVNSVYKDSVQYDPYSRKSIEQLNYAFMTSFVADDQLYQITQLKDNTAISRIHQNKVEIVHNFKEKYSFFSWYNQFRNTRNDYKFLRFNNGYNAFGFFETDHHNIDITKVSYQYDTLQYINSDSIIRLISDISNKNNISKKEIIEFEKTTLGLDIQNNRTTINHNGYYPRKFEKVEVETIDFIKSENEYITQDIEYLFTKNDQELKALFIDWNRTKFFNSVGKNYFPIRNENQTQVDRIFKEKYVKIREYLNKTGKPIVVKIKPDKSGYDAWIINEWRFNLYKIPQKNINGITLFISRQEDFNENE